MKTLSIRQPWAWLIVNGIKTVENRTWSTQYRGPLLIHASKTPDYTPDEYRNFRRGILAEYKIEMPETLPVGGIVGRVDLVACLTECDYEQDAEWHNPNCYAFVLRCPVELPFRPMPGKLHLFEVD